MPWVSAICCTRTQVDFQACRSGQRQVHTDRNKNSTQPWEGFAVYGGNRSIHGLHRSKWFARQVSKTNTLAWEYLPPGEETVSLSPSKLQWVKKVNNNCLPYFLVSLDSYRQSVSLSSTDSLPKIKWLKYLTVKQPSVKSMLRGWILHPQIVLFYHFTTKDGLSKK